ncbi:cell wall-binding repeat-containing protein [Candidatus Poriferisodalis sp.]|uniref:cell wall-binding repeat-containing protein n=1 Tax=Candidatus Poriferisodalis sp. TaxID=3101277 RepID=UPI003B01242F
MASVLAVVAGTPAQAANTSREVLDDHDRDPSTAEVRQFAGTDRYATALALAKAFAGQVGGIGSVPVAFVASGESLVDAVAVSALAGDEDAPVLLTRGGELHRGVKNFIEDYGVAQVYVLGGPAAISDSVLTAIRSAVNKPSVERIDGSDRYATAAQIASRIAVPGSWCGDTAVGAILANGGDVSLAGATAIAPIANRLSLPVLLTRADELPDSTQEWIETNDVRTVAVIGSETHVSQSVRAALTSSGVQTIIPVDGDSPAQMSVAVANLALNECADDLLPVNMMRAALINSSGHAVSPDAIAAAPYLAEGHLVPVLFVSDTLPASVRDWLASRPEETTGGDKIEYELLAIGGYSAVSAQVMADALAASASADALTVSITASAADTPDGMKPPAATATVFTLRFSDAVNLSAVQDQIGELVTVNGVPISTTGTDVAAAVVDASAAGSCDVRKVTVTLADVLESGDTLAIQAAAVGASEDKRKVTPTEITIATAPGDTTGPDISVVAVEDKRSEGAVGLVFLNVVSDDIGTGPGDGVIVTRDDTATRNADEREIRVTRSGGPALGPDAGITVTATTATPHAAAVDVEADNPLKAGDTILVSSDALRDVDNNKSGRAIATVDAARNSPELRRVYINVKTHASATGLVAAEQLDDDSAVAGTGVGSITIKAKADGDAAGADGNAWTVTIRRHSGYDPAKKADVAVAVDDRGKRVVATILNGRPTYGMLKAKLDAHSGFAALFEVTLGGYDDDDDATTCLAASDTLKLRVPTAGNGATIDIGDTTTTGQTAGVTLVAIEAHWHTSLSAASSEGEGLLAAILTAANARAPGDSPAADAAQTALGLATLDPDGAGRNVWAPGVTPTNQPGRVVRYIGVLDSADTWAIPRPNSNGDLIRFEAGNNTTNLVSGFAAAASAAANAQGVFVQHNAKQTGLYISDRGRIADPKPLAE